jgi:branched-chain amino acid transport system substrate-binding protein
MMKNKTLVRSVVAALVGVVAMAGTASAQDKGPIKLGFFAPLSGFAAQTGKDELNGLKFYLKQQGDTIAGRKIVVITEDTEAKPAVALTKVRKLVEKDGVHLLMGGLMASTGYALQPYVDGKKIPTLYPVMSPDDLTQRKRAKWIVRTGWSSSLPSHPFGEYAYKELGLRKIVTIGFDYAFGWEVIGGFQQTFEQAGGKIIQKLWTPVGAQDYAPFLPQIDKSADGVYAVMFGAGALQFIKQYKNFGLKDKMMLLGGGTTTDEHVLPSMGDEAIGTITALHYSAAIDTPANKAFAGPFKKFAGKSASYYSEGFYTGMEWAAAAIKKIDGKVEDKNAFIEALKTQQLNDLPRGPMKIDSYGNPVENVYIRKVEKVNGELQNTVIKTYHNVSQFWKYDPDSYLKQPVYDRDFPPMGEKKFPAMAK